MTERENLFRLMSENATVITPNNRLSVELQKQYFTHKNHQLTQKPQCLPYGVFLQNAFHAQAMEDTPPILLNDQQISHLWCQILTRNGAEDVGQGLLEGVKDAWSRCQSWRIDLQHPAFALTEQTRLFQLWAAEFQKTLEQAHFITADQIVGYLINNSGNLRVNTCIWYCFDDYTPLQQDLQQYLSAQGCQNVFLDLENQQQPSVFLRESENETAEYDDLVIWIQQQLDQGRRRVGIVIPDLETQAQKLQRLLSRYLPTTDFDISMGYPLSSFPLVDHALCWLQLNNQTLSNHQARLLLSSPWLTHSNSEMLARAELLQNNPLLQKERIDYSSFMGSLKASAPKLHQELQALQPLPDRGSPQMWLTVFVERLERLGFPGEYLLDSHNYQYYQRFIYLLEEFRQIQLISSELEQHEALNVLRTLADNTVFQVQKEPATVQVLGMLEAAGCVYDSIWVTGMTSECLPKKLKLSPFIPVAVQQEQAMPHASPQRELMLAEKQLRRLQNSSTRCVFSFPRLTKDKPNQPCPLLPNLSALQFSCTTTNAHPSLLERYTENYILPLAPEEPSRGGTSLLANQAKCPFKAFAAHRLHAGQTMEISTGLSNLERGQIIHSVMEILWRILKDQQTLAASTADELESHIQTAITQALEPFRKSDPHSFPALVQSVEFQRLKRLVHACLDWEKSRPAFVIESLEQSFTLELAGMTFNLRVDRIDRDSVDRQWVIDYKSSLPQSLPWNEERPREPQLLIYALLNDAITTLVFAALKNGQLYCKALTEEDYDLPGFTSIKQEELWSEHRNKWRRQLEQLAQEFQQGQCQPQPVSSSVCLQCDYQSLCRFKSG